MDRAFPYTPPSVLTRLRYADVFHLTEPVKERSIKRAFDLLFALLALLAALPLLCIVVISHFALALFISDQQGKLVISYRAVSRGQVFRKYKFRIVRKAFVDDAEASKGNWSAYANEWTPACLTHIGSILKRSYLDEIPQLFNVIVGHMSLVGPRPLAEEHYNRDLAQGNNYRKLIKAGLFGPTQALKGTVWFGNPEAEYDYLEKYLTLSGSGLILQDIKIIIHCICVVMKAKGL